MVSRTSFQEFENIAAYLKSNQELLQKIGKDEVENYYQTAKALLKEDLEIAKKDRKAFVAHNILDFLEHVMNGTAENEVENFFHIWKYNNSQKSSDKEELIKNIIRLQGIRKTMILAMLPYYTNEVNTAMRIAIEMDQWIEHLEIHTLQYCHRLMQEELFQENELISSVLDNTVNGVLVLDSRLRIYEINSLMCEIYKLKREEVIGKTLYEAFPFYKNSSISQAVKAVLEGTLVYISERPLENNNGFYEATLSPLYTQEAKVNGGIFIVNETTHRKKNEDSLKEAYRQLKQQQKEQQELNDFQQQVMASVPSMIFLYDVQKKAFIYTNDKIHKLIGYAPEEINKLEGSIFEHILPPQQPEDEEPQAELCNSEAYKGLKQNECLDKELRVIHKNGSLRWLRSKTKVFRQDKDGNPSLILGVAEDITEKKEAQDKLIQAKQQLIKANHELESRVEERTSELATSEKQLRTLTDALPVNIAYVDRHQKVKFANRAIEKYLGIEKESMLGRSISEIVREETYLKVKSGIEKACRGEYLQFEYQENPQDPDTRSFSMNFIPHLDQGSVVGFYWLAYDISDRKKSEQTTQRLYNEVRQNNLKLKRSNIAMDNFIYTASHDLKSPVLNLEGLLELLQYANEKQDYHQSSLYIDKLTETVTSLKKTLDDLIHITRIQQEAEPKEVERINILDIARDVKTDLKNKIIESGANIMENYQVKDIQYARSHLRSILYNLLSNAIKYRDPAKQLSISIKTIVKKNSVILEIEDNGLGMTITQQKQLFKVFQRMHAHIEGTGMGLFSVKRIVENNGGKIKVSSSPGEGSRFQVYL